MEVNPIKLNVKTKEDFDLNVNGTDVNQKGALTIVPDDGIYLGTGEKSESILKIPEFHETNPNLLMNSDFSNFYRCAGGLRDLTVITDRKYFLYDRWSIKTTGYNSKFTISAGKLAQNKKINSTFSIGTKNKVSTNTGGTFYQVLSECFDSGTELTFSGELRFNSSSQSEILSIGLCTVKYGKITEYISKNIILKNRDDFEKVTLSFKVPDYISLEGENLIQKYCVFFIGYYWNFSNTQLQFRNLKLERGNVATPWCPYGGSYEADRNACLQYYEKVGAFAAGTEEAKNKVMFSLPFKVEKINEPKLNIIKNIITWRVSGVNRLNTPILNLTEIKKTVNGCTIVVDDGSNGSEPNRSIFECNGDDFVEADAEPDFTQ